MKAVADTSSLIHPAKVSRFWELMKDTFEGILIPETVYREVLRGKSIMSPDVPVIERAVEEGWIKVRRVRQKTRSPENLGEGEREAIALAQEEKERVDWLLMDDRVASTTARLMGLRVRPAIYLLIYWTRNGVTDESQALEMLDNMVRAGYRLSTEDYVSVKEFIIGAHRRTKKGSRS